MLKSPRFVPFVANLPSVLTSTNISPHVRVDQRRKCATFGNCSTTLTETEMYLLRSVIKRSVHFSLLSSGFALFTGILFHFGSVYNQSDTAAVVLSRVHSSQSSLHGCQITAKIWQILKKIISVFSAFKSETKCTQN